MNVRFLTESSELRSRWPDIASLLTPVVEQAAMGEFTLVDILALCDAGRMYVGLCECDDIPVMAMAFEFRHYPQRTNINVVALGGHELEAVAAQFLQTFRDWARQAGAAEIEASCSKPMARLLKRYGFADTYECVRLSV